MKVKQKQTVSQQLAALSGMGVAALRAKYLEVFGEPSRSGNKAYLFKKLAWRISSPWPRAGYRNGPSAGPSRSHRSCSQSLVPVNSAVRIGKVAAAKRLPRAMSR